MISYQQDGIFITDDDNPSREPLILPLTSTDAEIENALSAYLPPPPPGPDWDGLANDMQTANGFKEYFVAMGELNPFSTIAQVSRFDDWRRDGNWQPFLSALQAGLAALHPENGALLAEEFLAAATTRNMDPAFLAALEDVMTQP